MKRFSMLIVTALAVLCVSSATAQKLGVDWGVIAGLNMADYSVKQVDKTTQWDDVKNDLGWQVGLMASVNVGRLSIEPQLIYVRNKVELTEGGEKASIKGNSLDVPVLVSLRVLGPVRVMAGPVFTVLNDNSGLKDISVEQLRSTCSYAVGLEARVLSKLRIDVRYNGQFKKKTTAIGKVDVNTFALNLGYYF
ncbi:MAG: porin family protein [Alistipes sp.]|nr:porin family protein [Rikenellaceae bacterium]MBQ8652526.1 porin family protein [Alistipes sp.]